jgi:hypothetical protein
MVASLPKGANRVAKEWPLPPGPMEEGGNELGIAFSACPAWHSSDLRVAAGDGGMSTVDSALCSRCSG